MRGSEATTPRVGAAVALAAAVALLAGCSTTSGAGPADSTAAGNVTTSAAPTPAAGSPATTLPPLPAEPAPLGASSTAAPVRLQVPAIGVDTPLENLGLVAGGELAAPSAWQTAGWYTRGVRPGDDGPAIIAGHVDSYLGPAVFHRLDDLEAGDVLTVTRADRSVVRFVVDSKAQYAKARFPTDAVYGPTPTPELRLVTCAGDFDRSARSYLDNLVVTAVLAS